MKPLFFGCLFLAFSSSSALIYDSAGNVNVSAVAEEFARRFAVWNRREERLKMRLNALGVNASEIFAIDDESEDVEKVLILTG